MRNAEQLDWRTRAFHRCLIQEAEGAEAERARLRLEKWRVKFLATWHENRKTREMEEKTRVAADWAKVTSAIVDRCLNASRAVGPKGGFVELAVEFTVPNASASEKARLKHKLLTIERRYIPARCHSGLGNRGDFPSEDYVRELRAALRCR